MLTRHICSNGTRIITEKVPTVRSLTIGIWVLTGSRNETALNNGISHFIEHMLFKGTENRNAKQIAEAFDSIGGHVNAFTAKEYTCYYARVMDLYKYDALELLTDMFFNSTFPEDEIAKEKNVIIEEIQMYEDTPDDVVYDLLGKASYNNHPLGSPIIGTRQRVEHFTREDLLAYKQTHYRPENVVISIAGSVDERFITEVKKQFNQFSHESIDTNEYKVERPVFRADSKIIEKEVEQAHLCYGFEGLAIDDKQMATLLMITNILGGSMGSRLFQEVREKRGLAYAVFAHQAVYRDSGLFVIYAGTNKEQLNLLESTINETVETLIEKGITDKELDNSKTQLKSNVLLGLESMNSRMTRNGRNELLLRKHRTIDEVMEEILQVDMGMVNRLIENLLSKKHARALVIPT